MTYVASLISNPAAPALDDTIVRLRDELGFGAVIFSHEVRYAFGGAHDICVMANGSIIERGDLPSLHESENEIVRRLMDRRGAA